MITKKQQDEILGRINRAETTDQLEKIRIESIGRKGVVTLALRTIKDLPVDQKASAGQAANRVKKTITNALEVRLNALENQETVPSEVLIDLTAPGLGHQLGHLHPLEMLKKELIELFWQIGFNVADGPEIETDWYCFEALNIPADHPARDMQDTFYLESGAVVRTHTSAVQIRYMEGHKPPIRIIAPGKVYRNEDEDATHGWAFTNLEGLVVDKAISLADLKGTLVYMLKGVFGQQTKVRLRPSYFPYVEPGLEADASCLKCQGKDQNCRLCKGTGWVELLGAGMVHPQVLRNVNIDPNQYSGFAFGVGLERLSVIKYGINDVRNLWRPNLAFLEQF
jgi:phenylalanyl-tRNA synthetase alpha chain